MKLTAAARFMAAAHYPHKPQSVYHCLAHMQAGTYSKEVAPSSLRVPVDVHTLSVEQPHQILKQPLGTLHHCRASVHACKQGQAAIPAARLPAAHPSLEPPRGASIALASAPQPTIAFAHRLLHAGASVGFAPMMGILSLTSKVLLCGGCYCLLYLQAMADSVVGRMALVPGQ